MQNKNTLINLENKKGEIETKRQLRRCRMDQQPRIVGCDNWHKWKSYLGIYSYSTLYYQNKRHEKGWFVAFRDFSF